jgi:uncharacterized membrane protein (DUF106 family)
MISLLAAQSRFAAGFMRWDRPLVAVLLLSLVIGLLMVLLFRYTSDQRAIRVAKDQLKAHMLAVRLFQDQLPVVLRSYTRILRGTGRYLRLAFKPLLLVIIPLTFLIVQLDRYLGFAPFSTGQPFLLKVKTADASGLDALALRLPAELATTAPAVHIPADNLVVWRLAAQKPGRFEVMVEAADQVSAKRVVVSSQLARLSPIRLRGSFWERFFASAEPPLAENSRIQSIAVTYPDRTIYFAWMEWNWIWLFFVISLLAGFFFKTVFRIEI